MWDYGMVEVREHDLCEFLLSACLEAIVECRSGEYRGSVKTVLFAQVVQRYGGKMSLRRRRQIARFIRRSILSEAEKGSTLGTILDNQVWLNTAEFIDGRMLGDDAEDDQREAEAKRRSLL